jgi:hypothetical protein
VPVPASLLKGRDNSDKYSYRVDAARPSCPPIPFPWPQPLSLLAPPAACRCCSSMATSHRSASICRLQLNQPSGKPWSSSSTGLSPPGLAHVRTRCSLQKGEIMKVLAGKNTVAGKNAVARKGAAAGKGAVTRKVLLQPGKWLNVGLG